MTVYYITKEKRLLWTETVYPRIWVISSHYAGIGEERKTERMQRVAEGGSGKGGRVD
jgi:hypothetical protein